MISEDEKSHLSVGFKQTMKAVKADKVLKIYLARQCEDRIKSPLVTAAEQYNIPIVYVKTMRELGAECGISVGASCAAALKY